MSWLGSLHILIIQCMYAVDASVCVCVRVCLWKGVLVFVWRTGGNQACTSSAVCRQDFRWQLWAVLHWCDTMASPELENATWPHVLHVEPHVRPLISRVDEPCFGQPVSHFGSTNGQPCYACRGVTLLMPEQYGEQLQIPLPCATACSGNMPLCRSPLSDASLGHLRSRAELKSALFSALDQDGDRHIAR